MPEFVVNIVNSMVALFYTLPDWMQYLSVTVFKILLVTIGVILIVAFSTYFERKVIGSMQSRVGPNRVRSARAWAAVRGCHQAGN